MNQALTTGRRQQRLADLHRALGAAVQSLHQHQLAVVTALRGSDASSQQSMLEEHRLRTAAVMQALTSLSIFIDRCRGLPGVAQTDEIIQRAS